MRTEICQELNARIFDYEKNYTVAHNVDLEEFDSEKQTRFYGFNSRNCRL